ncbi:hypothetical protein JG688_00014802 [Phytophthora aleatoria]|uniref:Uncharacterized protein n=1 Tax=Phytophthora aleatoria TaxID=2496075 RepID=A0A8J5M045_9STRA|nr:hypothetical protein JG688_00014802 [Phytophthora aleatoria]
MVRLVEILPPLPSDTRLERKTMDYMVSALVISLNQHWWCHTSSCFKTSKTTVSDSFCRYLFPRTRIPQTTFHLSGVTLERNLAQEYINGFNYEIMATFKCSHDIQFCLVGNMQLVEFTTVPRTLRSLLLHFQLVLLKCHIVPCTYLAG